MIESDVSAGFGSWLGDGMALCVLEPMVRVAVRGLMGVVGREWVRYQANTAQSINQC